MNQPEKKCTCGEPHFSKMVIHHKNVSCHLEPREFENLDCSECINVPTPPAQEKKCECLPHNVASIPNLHKTNCPKMEPPQQKEPETKIHFCTEQPCPIQEKEVVKIIHSAFSTSYVAQEPKTICTECQFEKGHSFECSQYKEQKWPAKEPETWNRECGHGDELHWKKCPDCREYLVRSGFQQELTEAETRGWNAAIESALKKVKQSDKYEEFSFGDAIELLKSLKKV